MKSLINDVIMENFHSSAYQLLEKIGEGGFGHVYRAKQNNTGQIVAIKFLAISSDFDEAKRARYIERFERETLLGSRLQHPNIVRLLDKGSCADQLYAVFEYIDGKTLKETLADSGSLSPVEAATVMAQVLDALAHAHQQGVIHRDIKPANIMLSKSGAKTHAKVLDFGIGTLVNEVRQQDYKSITLTQETLGTPSYSAPEQLRGEPPTLKTDLYVWGLVFIECLTGQPAMSGSSLASVFHKQLSQANVPLPASIVGHPIAALLRRVLHKKAHERSSDAQVLYKELIEINLANLVGDMAAAQADETAHDLTVLAPDFDETIINNKKVHQTALTERKQITVLSIKLSAHIVSDEKIDHEVIDALIHDQKNQCLDTATRYGAYHVGTLGDSLLFYFGYPAVSDNDSRLCARTALDIVSDLHKRNALLKNSQGIEFDISIGMHSGLMTCYADTTPEGDTANIAMQLAHLAANRQILCSAASRKLLENHLEFEPLQSTLLGFDRAETALFKLIAERHVEAFGFLRSTQNNNAFTGREQEFKQLKSLLEKTVEPTNNCKRVHIHGEAGIGKSRLIFEFRNSAKQMTHYVAQCLPEHRNNALYPVLNVIKHKYSLDLLTAENAVQKLRNEIAELALPQKQESIAILCVWLGLPLPEEIPVLALSPDLQKQILFSTLIALLISRDKTETAPANLFLFEDMHWADPTSLEFIASLSGDKSFHDAKDLFICTSRQPMPELLNESGFQVIELQRLTQEKTREFAVKLFAQQNVASALLDVVVERTDGIPLFIEELINMLKQKGLVQHLNGITDFVNTQVIDEVPVSLRDSLQQKLDALVYAKETAQLAATIGREFAYELLVAGSEHSESQVQNDLNEMIDAGLIYQQRKVNGDSYLFKHALVRDAAYDTIPSALLVDVHGRVADAMISQQNVVPMVLAEHLANAQRYAEAAELGLSSSQTALGQSLSQNAFDIANIAISWNELRETNADKFETLLNLLAVTLPAIMTVKGMGADEVAVELERCESALEKLKHLPAGALSKAQSVLERSSKFALAGFYNMRSMRVKARELSEELLEEAINEGDIEFEIAIRSHLGHNYYMEGHYLRAREALETAISLYDPDIHQGLAIKYSLEPESYCRMTLALALWKLGYADQAVSMIKEAQQKATALGHLASVGLANIYLGLVAYFCGDVKAINDVAKTNAELCQQHPDIAFSMLFLNCLQEWVNQETTHTQAFIAQKRQVNELYAMTFYEATLAETKIKQGLYKEALSILEKSIEWCHKTEETIALSTLHRMQAKAYLASGKHTSSDAIRALYTSIEVAKNQGSIALELDACLDLCQIFSQQNKKDKAFTLLSPLLNQFSEGFDTKVYREAKQLLANCNEFA